MSNVAEKKPPRSNVALAAALRAQGNTLITLADTLDMEPAATAAATPAAEPFLTCKQVAKLTNQHEDTIARHRRAGRLRSHKIGSRFLYLYSELVADLMQVEPNATLNAIASGAGATEEFSNVRPIHTNGVTPRGRAAKGVGR